MYRRPFRYFTPFAFSRPQATVSTASGLSSLNVTRKRRPLESFWLSQTYSSPSGPKQMPIGAATPVSGCGGTTNHRYGVPPGASRRKMAPGWVRALFGAAITSLSCGSTARPSGFVQVGGICTLTAALAARATAAMQAAGKMRWVLVMS